MNVRRLALPALFLGIAVALWMGADLLWSISVEIRETALNPACRLLHDRVEMALDCRSQNQFGFFLAIIAPFLGFGALLAMSVSIICTFKRAKLLFLRPSLAYHPQGSGWLDLGGRSHERDITGTSSDDADIRRDQ